MHIGARLPAPDGVPGDVPHPLQPLDALLDRASRASHPAREPRVGHPTVHLQQREELEVQRVEHAWVGFRPHRQSPSEL